MRNTLLIRTGQGEDGNCEWLPLDDAGQPVGRVRSGDLTAAAAEANGLRVVVLVPGIDCLLTQATIPGRNRQKLLRAVPFALEEQLVEDVENSHFSLGPALPGGGYPVVVIATRRIDAILDACRSAGLDVYQLVPDLLAVPCTGDAVCVVIDGDMALVRTGPYSGFVVDTENLGLLLAAQEQPEGSLARPVSIQIPTGAVLPDLGEAAATAEISRYEGSALMLFSQSPGGGFIDLLQGVYSRNQEWGKLWRPWRATAALLLAGVLLSNIVTGVDYFRLRNEQEELNVRMQSVFMESFPGTRRVVDPRVQMQQQLEQLQRLAGSGGRFLTLLARSADVLRTAKDIEIAGASYRAGRLDVDLTAANLQVLDQLKQSLSARGLVVEIQSAAADAGQRVKSRLRIQGSEA
ncbi:MAG: type II secretion system protein GspL [Gammaproteobacteria bacterium]